MVPSGIDKEKLLIQLNRLEEHYSRLGDIYERLLHEENKDLLFSAAERILQITIEDCLNIGNHLIAGIPLRRADTYREIFKRLEEAGILSIELGEKLQACASFRNRIVHLYWEVSRDEIIAKLEDRDCFKEFARVVCQYARA